MKKQCFWVPATVQFITGFVILFSILNGLEVLWNIYVQAIVVLFFQLTILKLSYHLYFRK